MDARGRPRRRVRPIVIIVDTGPLVAAAVRTDPDHARCAALFTDRPELLVVPQLVITEAAYLVGRIAGPAAEADFVRSLAEARLTFRAAGADSLRRTAELMTTYVDLPLGTVDAAVVATAEQLNATTIATLDRRHFTVVRPQHAAHFTLLP